MHIIPRSEEHLPASDEKRKENEIGKERDNNRKEKTQSEELPENERECKAKEQTSALKQAKDIQKKDEIGKVRAICNVMRKLEVPKESILRVCGEWARWIARATVEGFPTAARAAMALLAKDNDWDMIYKARKILFRAATRKDLASDEACKRVLRIMFDKIVRPPGTDKVEARQVGVFAIVGEVSGEPPERRSLSPSVGVDQGESAQRNDG